MQPNGSREVDALSLRSPLGVPASPRGPSIVSFLELPPPRPRFPRVSRSRSPCSEFLVGSFGLILVSEVFAASKGISSFRSSSPLHRVTITSRPAGSLHFSAHFLSVIPLSIFDQCTCQGEPESSKPPPFHLHP